MDREAVTLSPFLTGLGRGLGLDDSAAAALFPTPGDLYRLLNPRAVDTPALDLIDEHLVDLEAGVIDRLAISMPPQEGKSSRISETFPLWMLLRNPERRIVIASYSDELAKRWGRLVRRHIETWDGTDETTDLGLRIRPESRAADRWELDQHAGGLVTAGVRGGVTGRPSDVFIIDDPYKDRREASSRLTRDTVWDFLTSVVIPRLAPGAPIVIVHCLTGETPVLMADGAERPLRDVRPGDRVATYSGGKITTSTVRRWANQGPDIIYEIRMTSGATVRANARHPFLTIKDGIETWQRTDTLRPGSRILRATGGSGAESPATTRAAVTSPSAARASAVGTTNRPDGQPGTAHLPLPTRTPADAPRTSTGTASPPRSAPPSRQHRAVSARSVSSPLPPRTPPPAGAAGSASTTATTRSGSADCSATPATSPSATSRPPTSSAPPLTTWSVTPDEVLEVVPAGIEDVFDVQIDETENFIANGLVSHNTRWNEDDLIGRLKREQPGRWRFLNIPALSEGGEDPLGRPEGVWMTSARGRSVRDWQKTREGVGERDFAALYQGRPNPAAGGLFARNTFRYWQPTPDPWRVAVPGRVIEVRQGFRFATVDFAGSTRTSADWTVCAVWCMSLTGELILLDRWRGQEKPEMHWDFIRPVVERWGAKLFIEPSQFATDAVYAAGREGWALDKVHPDTDKYTRAVPAARRIRQGNVFFPAHAPWLGELVEELAEFPNGRHDDQVDVVSYAHRVVSENWLADPGQTEQDTSPPPRSTVPDPYGGDGFDPDLAQF